MKRNLIIVVTVVIFFIAIAVYYYQYSEDLMTALGYCNYVRESNTSTWEGSTKSKEQQRQEVLNRAFSTIEDGDVLMEIERERPEADQNRMAVVIAIYGGYDVGPPPVNPELHNHPKLSFFFFCDEGYNYQVTEPWQTIKTPYFNLDTEIDLKTKNSLSVLQDVSHINNMRAKYFDHVGWRLPELRSFRYIFYVGGSFDLSQATAETLYNQVIDNLSKENKTMIVPVHPVAHQTIITESQLAAGQYRYSKDRVLQQAQHYVEDWLCPQIPGQVVWLGVMFYDAYSVGMRRVLYELNQECQIWSLEDQVAFPFLLWKHGMTDSIIKVAEAICPQYLNIHDRGGNNCRGYHSPAPPL